MKQDYKTINYPTNSSGAQLLDRGIHPNVANDSVENNMRGFSVQQLPTYSVFAGDAELNNGVKSVSPYNQSAPL